MKRVPPMPQQYDVTKEIMDAVRELMARYKEIEAMVKKVETIAEAQKKSYHDFATDVFKTREYTENLLKLPTGPEGKSGRDGKDGRPGRDANPIDYSALAQEAVRYIPIPKNGKNGKDGRDGVSPSVDEILNALFGSKRLTLDQIVDLRPYLDNLRRAVMRGGGDTIAAGSGVTITQSGGVKTISASSSGITFETPSGTINGVNTTFTVTHTPLYIIVDGVTYFENDGFTRATLILTLSVPPTGFIRSAYAS